MENLHVDHLVALNQARHAELLREAAVQRMLREIDGSAAEQAQADEENGGAASFWATLLALPGRLKPA